MDRDECNATRFRGDGRGHYESWFQRANHPTRALAFWIRYTIFEPAGRPDDAVAELWAIWFDGETGRIVPVKQLVPLAESRFSRDALDVRIGAATLDGSTVRGSAAALGHRIAWSLDYSTPSSPLTLLPDALYRTPIPKAKLLVGSPLAAFSGSIDVDGEPQAIDAWVGSQNHNWGSKHTDEYAWGQVAGFDGDETAFLEVATARIHLGPARSPWLSPIVLRLGRREHRFDRVTTALRARASFAPFEWRFASSNDGLRIEGAITAESRDFVSLLYDNPPGGRKVCLNTKIATCTVRVEGLGPSPLELTSTRRAAFEMLGDRRHPSVTTLEV